MLMLMYTQCSHTHVYTEERREGHREGGRERVRERHTDRGERARGGRERIESE